MCPLTLDQFRIILSMIFFIVFSLLMVTANVTEYNASIEKENEVVVSELTATSLSINSKIADIAADIFLLKDLVQNKDILELNGGTKFKTEAAKVVLEKEVAIWLDNRNIYDQVRIIDITGQEILRVNYNHSGSSAISGNSLQNKRGSYYFINSIGINNNSLYISKFDFNVEKGKIEYVNDEIKRTLRFATPLIDKDNNKIGIMVFNYLSADLFHYTDDFVDYEVVNENGFYLHAINQEIEYGFMFEDKVDEVFEKYHDFDLININREDITQTMENNEVYSAFVVSDLTLSDSVTEKLSERIEVILDGGNLFFFTETVLHETTAYSILISKYIIYSILLVALSFGLSRAIDEVEHLREKQIKLLKYSSEYDHLTGVPNRLNIYEKIKHALEQERNVTILFIDFDGFKSVNDKLGHDGGDDVVSRVGGDEFLLALFDLTDDKVITRICNMIIDKFRIPFIIDGNTSNLGVSIGVAKSNKNQKLNTLINRADKAMYFVKKGTKNGFIFDTDIVEL